MKPARPVASTRNDASKPETGRPSVKSSAAPRAMLIVPSVTMNGGRPPQLISAPLASPHARPTSEPEQQSDRDRLAPLERGSQHDAGERDDGADREVDAAGQDHEGHPDGDDRVDARLLGDVEQVRDRQEVRREDPQHHAERREPDDRPELARGNQLASPSAARSTRSSVASAASISA